MAFGARFTECAEPAVDGRTCLDLNEIPPNSSTCSSSPGNRLRLLLRFLADVDLAKTPFIRSMMAELPELEREPSLGRPGDSRDASGGAKEGEG